MHYHAEVWLPKEVGNGVLTLEGREQLDGLLATLLARYSENADVNEGSSCDSFYDWYVVGGRYTGRHDNYHGWEDPANMEICDICNGTGTRTDAVAEQLTPNNDPATALVRDMLSQINPRGRVAKKYRDAEPAMGMMHAELLATSREYHPEYESVPSKRFYSVLVWGMRAKEIKASDLQQYASAKTKTPLFDELNVTGRRFNFEEEAK